MTVAWDLHYDRRVPAEFLAHFKRGGVAHSLAQYAKNAPFPLDLQMRHDPRSGAHHASLYVGLTDVLKVTPRSEGRLSLSAHKTWSEGSFGFKSDWTNPRTVEEWRSDWTEVEHYLDHVIPRATKKHAGKEGTVQAAASAFSGKSRVMVDREAVVRFKDQETKDRIRAEVTGPILQTVRDVEGIPGKRPESFGGKCDLLAIDDEGRLLAVEVKPRGAGTIRWAAAQATVYAELFRRWTVSSVEGVPSAGEILHGMLDQRQELGLANRMRPFIPDQPEVVPVVAVQSGASPKYLADLRKVQNALVQGGVGDEQLKVYEVNLAGRLRELPSRDG